MTIVSDHQPKKMEAHADTLTLNSAVLATIICVRQRSLEDMHMHIALIGQKKGFSRAADKESDATNIILSCSSSSASLRRLKQS